MRDRRLVHRLQRGDVDALQQIYHQYKDDLLTVAMSLLGEVHAAEDCVHDVFVHFAEAPADLRVNRSLRGYLVRCVANRAKNMLKRRQLPPEPSSDDINLDSGFEKMHCCRMTKHVRGDSTDRSAELRR